MQQGNDTKLNSGDLRAILADWYIEELFCSSIVSIILTSHIICNLDWAFTKAVSGLVSRVEALLGSNTAPAAVRVETQLEAARGLNAICEKTRVMLHDFQCL